MRCVLPIMGRLKSKNLLLIVYPLQPLYKNAFVFAVSCSSVWDWWRCKLIEAGNVQPHVVGHVVQANFIRTLIDCIKE